MSSLLFREMLGGMLPGSVVRAGRSVHARLRLGPGL